MRQLFVLALLVTAAAPVYAARHFTVSVAMAKVEYGINDKVESYIRRELRSLNDVTIVDQDPDFRISLTTHRYEGRETVYGLGALVTNLRTGKVAFWVVYATPERFIRNECDEIVVGFDRYVLEPLRNGSK